jgi:hypothetical protein
MKLNQLLRQHLPQDVCVVPTMTAFFTSTRQCLLGMFYNYLQRPW